jgi:hypothetical protein
MNPGPSRGWDLDIHPTVFVAVIAQPHRSVVAIYILGIGVWPEGHVLLPKELLAVTVARGFLSHLVLHRRFQLMEIPRRRDESAPEDLNLRDAAYETAALPG